MPSGCRGDRSLGVWWQLRLEKPESCHKRPLLLGHGLWAAACGRHGGSEGLGGMVRGCGLKGLDCCALLTGDGGLVQG